MGKQILSVCMCECALGYSLNGWTNLLQTSYLRSVGSQFEAKSKLMGLGRFKKKTIFSETALTILFKHHIWVSLDKVLV